VPVVGLFYNRPGGMSVGGARTSSHCPPCRLRRRRSSGLLPGCEHSHAKTSCWVLRLDGRLATFQVDTVRRYARNAFPTALVYGNTNHAA
jgi:hypothetical protein